MIPGIQGIHPVIGASSPPGGNGATPTYVTNGGFVDNGSGPTVVNVPYPGSVAANDIAILHAIIFDSTVANTVDTPSGWTLIDQQRVFSEADNSTRMALFWRRMVGSEGGSTVTITASATHGGTDTFGGIISIWSGCKTSGDPYEAEATSIGNDASMVGPSITTLGPNRRVLHFGACYTQASATPSAGYTERYDVQTASGTPEAGVFLYGIEAAVAGVVSSATHSLSGSKRWRTMALGLIPN